MISGTITRQISGPLPPASELEHYEDVFPGAAQTIISWATEETDFRRRMIEEDAAHQRRMDWADMIRSYVGLVMGAGIAIAGFVVSYKLAIVGSQIAATVIAALDIGSIVGIFVYGTIRRQKSDQEG